MKKYVLSIKADNTPGILARVCQLFSKRAYNLERVTAEAAENEEIYRITLITKVEKDNQISLIIKQIRKLENVHKVILMEN